MATKPIILAVDDDLPVLRAVERDLRARYGEQYRIVAANSGAEALEAVRQLTLRGSTIALFMVDQRMPQMTGIEFLSQAVELQADARRVLLTAYADTDVAIRAINEIRLDHYILKPWDPPDEKLYPILDDLLSDWSATFRPAFEGVRLLAGRWAPGGHLIRDFLTRNQVPYAWLDPTDDAEGRRLAASLEDGEPIDPAVPLVLFADGSTLRDPSTHQIAEKVGLQTKAALPFYDVVIVGGGPAGLAAAVYGASEGLKTILVESEAPGGQAGTTSRIENYLGFPAGLSGGDLARRAPGPGTAARRRDPLARRGDRHPARGPLPGRHPRRGRRGLVPDGGGRDRGQLSPARGAGRRRARRSGDLLRRRHHRGGPLPRPGGRGGGRRQLGRPGGGLPVPLREAGDADGAHPGPLGHEPVPDRPDRGLPEHRGPLRDVGDGGTRRGAPGLGDGHRPRRR